MTIYDIMEKFIDYVTVNSPNLTAELVEKKRNLMVILSLWQIGFTGLVFVICIFFSHKIAGPLYKLVQYLRAVKAGSSKGKLTFRKGDYFQELAEEYNTTIETIQENYRNDFNYLKEVNTYISNLSMVVPEDKRPLINEINKKLEEIQSRYNTI